jgi:hypothetical protein
MTERARLARRPIEVATMPKHTLFLIHGIGAHGSNWAERAEGPIETLKRVSRQYAYFQQRPLEDKVAFEPIHYDDVFQAATTRWQNDARFLEEHDPTGISGDLTQWMSSASALERNFWWTNVCDLVLYRLSPTYRQRVRSEVIDAIAGKVEELMRTERSATCSVLAHSMGTAVAHDCLHLLGTVRWGGAVNALGPRHWRFNHVFMVANTSRLLQSQDQEMKRAYESIVRPGANADANSYCKTYWNFLHVADPVPFPRAFAPVGWTQYTSIPVRHFHEFSIHNLSHHLLHPRVHIPILRKLVTPRAVTPEEEIRAVNDDNFPQFAGDPARVLRLKELSSGLDAIRRALPEDPSPPELARSLVAFWALTGEYV